MALATLRNSFSRVAARRRRYVVFYDASCALCRRTRDWLERAELDAPPRFIDVNDRAAMARWPNIDPHRAQHEVFVLDPQGQVFAGYDAALRLAEGVQPALRQWDSLLRWTPVHWLGAQLYHQVSVHRHQLSQWLPREQRRDGEREAAWRKPDRERRSILMSMRCERRGRRRGRQINPLKGAIAGALGGLAAAWVMEQAQAIATDLGQRQGGERSESSDGQSSRSSEQREEAASQQQQAQASQQEPATVKAAEVVAQRVLHRELTEPEKPIAGQMVHYGFGAAVGGLYGMLAELIPSITMRSGLAYGTAVWAIADEVAVPAAGFAEPPNKQPLRIHVYALGMHLVYGLALEIVRRITRWTLR